MSNHYAVNPPKEPPTDQPSDQPAGPPEPPKEAPPKPPAEPGPSTPVEAPARMEATQAPGAAGPRTEALPDGTTSIALVLGAGISAPQAPGPEARTDVP
jgi:hypothetical protein